jgi:RNA polymerase sigma-70 factor (ECF subfamily)
MSACRIAHQKEEYQGGIAIKKRMPKNQMETSLSDEGLVKSILSGDENAFSRLYELYRRPVYNAAYRVMQNPEEARDATQDIFIKIFRHLHRWDFNKSKLSTWIFRLAANHSIDCWRIRARRAESQLSIKNTEKIMRLYALGGATRSPFVDMKHKERVDAVRHRVRSLPYTQKKTFMLRYFQELKLEEIAETESLSLGTVKSSLFRATQSVRRSVHFDG